MLLPLLIVIRHIDLYVLVLIVGFDGFSAGFGFYFRYASSAVVVLFINSVLFAVDFDYFYPYRFIFGNEYLSLLPLINGFASLCKPSNLSATSRHFSWSISLSASSAVLS